MAFFVRVRKRVINLEDELFGIAQPNHAAWRRFALEVRAEGLRDHLLSSREGVRDSVEVRELRELLRKEFNHCRAKFDEWQRAQTEDLDIQQLLSDEPSSFILEPLFRAVQTTVDSRADSFYFASPKLDGKLDDRAWLDEFRGQYFTKPFKRPRFVKSGVHAAAARYDPTTQEVEVNIEHPFMEKLSGGGKRRNPAKLFAFSEVLLEGVLQDNGLDAARVADVLGIRDRILRLMAGDAPPTAREAIRLLRVANQDSDALERVVGVVFRVLGFHYERRGGPVAGADGVLIARLGRHGQKADQSENFSVVYDAKQTDRPSVPADKIDLASLEAFRQSESAAYGFFLASRYAAEEDPNGKLNR